MDSIPRIRRELICRFESLVRTRAHALGIGPEEFGDWVKGIVGEGITIAIVRQEKWNPEKGDFLHWAFLQTRNLLKKELRQEERHLKAVMAIVEKREISNKKPHFVETIALRDELLGILKQLTEDQQRALVLYYLNGMTVAKLADFLGKPPKFVYGLLQKARKKAFEVHQQQQTPSASEEKKKKTFRSSVRNPTPRVYTISEGVRSHDVCD